MAFLALFQRRLFGDASLTFQGYQSGTPSDHLGHELVAHGLHGLGLGWLTALRAATVLPASLAAPCLYLALRRLELGRRAALFGTLLAVLSGCALFWGTSMEKYGLLLGAAPLAFLLASLAPRRSLLGAVAIFALAATVLFLGHQTALTAAPAVGLLVVMSLWRGGVDRRRLGLALAVVAIVLVVGGSLAYGAYAERKSLGGLSFGQRLNPYGLTLGTWGGRLRDPLAASLWLLLPAAALGAWFDARSERPNRLRLALAACWSLPNLLLLSVIGAPNHGSYFLTALPGLAWLSAAWAEHALTGRGTRRGTGTGWMTRLRVRMGRGTAAALVAILVWQAVHGVRYVKAYDRSLPAASRDWLEGLEDVTGGAGTYVAHDDAVYTLVHSYSTLVAHRPGQARVLGADRAGEVMEIFLDWAVAADGLGRPLYVDPGLLELARHDELTERCLALIEERFVLEPEESGSFRVLRGRVRR